MLAATLAATAFAVGAPNAVGPFGERCEYVEAGPPGPRGNKLVLVAGPSLFWIATDRGKIVVHDLYGARCVGRQATVHNIDRIVLRFSDEGEGAIVDASGGPFAPGATPERRGSEIEMSAFGARLEYIGTRRADSIVARTLRDGRVALNVDKRSDHGAPDWDIGLFGGVPEVLRIRGFKGNDRIDARRLTGMGDNQLNHVIRLFGDAGNDTILGSPGSEWRLNDGPGNDLVIAGAGSDSVDIGRGRDTIYGGPGGDDLIYEGHFGRFGSSAKQPHDPPDRIYGGGGEDQIIDLNGSSDLIRCGSGRDDVERERIDHPAADCEHVRY